MKSKEFANKGVKRNKTPLQNIVIIVHVGKVKEEACPDMLKALEVYKFKDIGHLTWSSDYEKDYDGVSCRFYHGFITPEELKEKLGVKQWMKFCNGKRKFIIQRRINHNNI